MKRNPWSAYLTNGQLLLLLAILLLGILVRVVGIGEAPRGFNQDEASAGYDAFAILKYGIDRNGIHNPVHLIAWGSGQNAAYSWLCMPLIALLGLSVWSVRLPMALVGCVSVVIFYFLLKNIHRENKAFVLLGTFLFAIFPWHIMKSRWSLESNLFPDLVLWGTFLLSQYLKNPAGSMGLWRSLPFLPMPTARPIASSPSLCCRCSSGCWSKRKSAGSGCSPGAALWAF